MILESPPEITYSYTVEFRNLGLGDAGWSLISRVYTYDRAAEVVESNRASDLANIYMDRYEYRICKCIEIKTDEC